MSQSQQPANDSGGAPLAWITGGATGSGVASAEKLGA